MKFYDSNYQALRRRILYDEPFCRMCYERGIYMKAEVVDHIRPRSVAPNLVGDKDNLQPLCKPCHEEKTAIENRRRNIENASRHKTRSFGADAHGNLLQKFDSNVI